jgi:hypothetical protein
MYTGCGGDNEGSRRVQARRREACRCDKLDRGSVVSATRMLSLPFATLLLFLL